ncbi:MAG: hypothetical protein PHC70_02515 [Patescibacteria group bacterium]|jgi:hypothetical protein|nr:hypothetical protein [Patescibacteria group bacterium]
MKEAIESREESEKALVAFAVDNKDLSEIEDLSLAKLAIETTLVRHGLTTAINCLPTTFLGEELALHLDLMTQGTRDHVPFMRAMINLFALDPPGLTSNRVFILTLDNILPKLINSPDDLAVIIGDQERNKDYVSNELHAIALNNLNTDAYWKRRIERLIRRKDFRRAWDDLYRALIGWPGKGKVQFCLNASLAMVGRLGEELYSAMQRAEAISQAGLKNWRRKAGRERTLLIGLEHEQERRIAALFSDRSVKLEVATLANVSPEGLTLIHLARHFRGRRNLRRAVKKARARGAAA